MLHDLFAYWLLGAAWWHGWIIGGEGVSKTARMVFVQLLVALCWPGIIAFAVWNLIKK